MGGVAVGGDVAAEVADAAGVPVGGAVAAADTEGSELLDGSAVPVDVCAGVPVRAALLVVDRVGEEVCVGACVPAAVALTEEEADAEALALLDTLGEGETAGGVDVGWLLPDTEGVAVEAPVAAGVPLLVVVRELVRVAECVIGEEGVAGCVTAPVDDGEALTLGLPDVLDVCDGDGEDDTLGVGGVVE